MSRKKYTENDLRAAINETRLETRGKQIERSAGIMQAYADKIAALEAELGQVNGLKNDMALKDHQLNKALNELTALKALIQTVLNNMGTYPRQHVYELLENGLKGSA